MNLSMAGWSLIFCSFSFIWMKLNSCKKLRAIFVNELGNGLFSMISVRLCSFPSFSGHNIASIFDNAGSSER